MDTGRSLLDLSATQLARLMREQRVSPREVMDVHVARMREVNPRLNALIAERFEAARSEAAEAETLIARTKDPDELPPLCGVPCSIKEYLGLAGLPQTGGFVHLRDRIAPRDGTVVQRIRAAGAIPLGVTNGPEGGMWMETHNKVFGRTHNPWNLAHTAGGSSGGEGAVVAAGAAPFGLGSDVAGSIRFPAAFCGVVGHKPTGRLIPNTGHFPTSPGEVNGILVCGPIVRRVEDILPILRIIAGPDDQDPQTRAGWLGDPHGIDARDLEVFILVGEGFPRVAADVRGAVEAAAAALVAAGATRHDLRVPKMRHALEIWSAMMAEATEVRFGDSIGVDQPFSARKELVRLALGRSDFTLPTVALALLESGQGLLAGRLERMAGLGRELQHELESALGERGVLVHPPYTRAAPRHRLPLLTPLDFVCCAIFSVFEFPVTQVPVGFGAHGLPLGVQLVGRRGNDHVTVAAASIVESALGGWVRANP